jgi:hypothetical protein
LLGTLKVNLFCGGGGYLNTNTEMERMQKEAVMASINPFIARLYRWITLQIPCSVCQNYKYLQKSLAPNLITEV